MKKSNYLNSLFNNPNMSSAEFRKLKKREEIRTHWYINLYFIGILIKKPRIFR